MSTVTKLSTKQWPPATQSKYKIVADNLHRPGLHKVDDAEGKERLVSGGIWVIGLARNEYSNGWCNVIEFYDQDNNLCKWLMPRSLLAGEKTEIIKQLLDRGLFVASGATSKTDLFDYVSFGDKKDRYTTVQSTGWHGESFVLNERVIGDGNYLLMSPEPVKESHGTIESWREKIASKCVGNSRLVLGVSLALANPLLKIAGVESGGIHIVGESSSGKTKALTVASSVFNMEVNSWRATTNGLEGTAARHSDVGLLMDEIGQSDAKDAGATAYMLANGRGKSRAQKDGSAKKVATWRLLILSSGEVSLSDQMTIANVKSHAGQELRLVNVDADAGKGMGMFENIHGAAKASEFADSLSQLAKEHTGHAGPAFIEYIQSNKDQCLAKVAEVEKLLIEVTDSFNEPGQVQRVAKRFALIGAAGELATDAGITGWPEGSAMHAAVECFRAWRASWAPEGSHEEQRAITQVQAFLQQHQSRFETLPGDGHTPINRAGFTSCSEFWIYPGVFTKDICAGLRADSVTKVLLDRGWLIQDSGSGRQARRTAQTKRQRFYVISDSILDESQSC